jgi:hypothetical protein
MNMWTEPPPRPRPFNRDFQDFITRNAWGEIWTRSGLPRHTRSLLTLAMMVALNRGDEFRMHVKAAFNNGVTRDEIKEVSAAIGDLLRRSCGELRLSHRGRRFHGDGWQARCQKDKLRRRGNGHDCD